MNERHQEKTARKFTFSDISIRIIRQKLWKKLYLLYLKRKDRIISAYEDQENLKMADIFFKKSYRNQKCNIWK